MFWSLFLSTSLFSEAVERLDNASSIEVVVKVGAEGFGNTAKKHLWFKRGGYFRAEEGSIVDIAAPGKGWTLDRKRRIYQERPPLPAFLRPTSILGLSEWGAYPALGLSGPTPWHGHRALRLELDGRSMTKEAKLFVFFDPKTKLPLGISANLGSVTQLRLFDEWKLNQSLDPNLFKFTPQSGWSKVFGHWK